MVKIITGEWDGQPIWREKTAQEKLLDTLYNMEVENKKLSSKKIYEQRTNDN